jgi:hypothetical protein
MPSSEPLAESSFSLSSLLYLIYLLLLLNIRGQVYC